LDIDNKHDYGDDKSYAIYKSIVRAIFVTGNNRVMTFHSYSNHRVDDNDSVGDDGVSFSKKRRSDVKAFANKKLFQNAYPEAL
jgi:hypothetical protein